MCEDGKNCEICTFLDFSLIGLRVMTAIEENAWSEANFKREISAKN